MRPKLERTLGFGRARKRAIAAAIAMALPVAALAASSALATSVLREEFAPFADCPVEQSAVCLVATTTSGEFVIDRKTVPIEKPILLQGGLASTSFATQPLLGAADGNTLSRTPLTVPGGLLGIAGLGGEVTATAEIAGPPTSVSINRLNLLIQQGTAVTLPIKVKLDNPVLGNECYVGTDAEPIVLHLTTGTTSPPFPYKPISGTRGKLEGKARGKITASQGVSLVDNTFTVPGASGCGGVLAPVVDLAVDLDIGIPSAAGMNTAVMTGAFEETLSELAARYKPKPKRPKKTG